jgi:hypothetical protein
MSEMREPLKMEPSVGLRPPCFLLLPETVRADGAGLRAALKADDRPPPVAGPRTDCRLLAAGVEAASSAAADELAAGAG